MPFPVENLLNGAPELITVNSDDDSLTALALMIKHDFSQLPVVNAERRSLGMVTGDSILRASVHLGQSPAILRVRDAAIKAREFRPEDDLFDLLDDLRDAYAVLVVDGERRVIGIVTSYDATEYFRRRAEDLMLVEDIETGLREHIRAAFTDQRGDLDTSAL